MHLCNIFTWFSYFYLFILLIVMFFVFFYKRDNNNNNINNNNIKNIRIKKFENCIHIQPQQRQYSDNKY